MLMKIAQRGIDEGLSCGREDREESEMISYQAGNARANSQVWGMLKCQESGGGGFGIYGI